MQVTCDGTGAKRCESVTMPPRFVRVFFLGILGRAHRLPCNFKASRPHASRKIPGIVRQVNIAACLRSLPVVACRSHAFVALRQRCCATNMLFGRRLEEPNLAHRQGQPPALDRHVIKQAVHKTDKAGDWNALVLRYAHSLTFAISLPLCIPRVVAFS